MIATSVFALILLGISGLMLDSHSRALRRVTARTDLDEFARRFAGAQYRRRMFASGTIGVVGAAIAIAPLVPRRPLPMSIYLLLLVSACGWIVLLALIDVLATHAYYRRLRGQHLAAEAKLAQELQSVRERTEQPSRTP